MDGYLVDEGWNESKRICNIPTGSDEAGYGEVAWELLWYARQYCIKVGRTDKLNVSIAENGTGGLHIDKEKDKKDKVKIELIV